jgi:hypothetical protein
MMPPHDIGSLLYRLGHMGLDAPGARELELALEMIFLASVQSGDRQADFILAGKLAIAYQSGGLAACHEFAPEVIGKLLLSQFA